VRGLFIAFEGIEGAGKSTQVARLAERLKRGGADPLMVREPGGTELGEEVRRLLLHAGDMTPASELLLFQVARAEVVAHVIRPALTEGRIVIADRYELSSRAYQAAGRGLPASRVKAAIALATEGLVPDLYIVLDLPVDVGRKRQAESGKQQDRLERADDDFHARVAEAFLNAHGANLVHVAAEGDADKVAETVWQAVMSRFPHVTGG